MIRVKHCFETGWGLLLFHLRPVIPQWSSGCRSRLDHLGHGFKSSVAFVSIFFFFQIEETCTFMNISSSKYYLSVI